MVRTLSLPRTGDGGVLSRGAVLASEFTVYPRAQTEAERPVGEGTCPDQGQKACTLDQDGGGGGCEKQSASQRASRTGRCTWDAYGMAEKEEEAGHGAGAHQRGAEDWPGRSSHREEQKKGLCSVCWKVSREFRWDGEMTQ